MEDMVYFIAIAGIVFLIYLYILYGLVNFYKDVKSEQEYFESRKVFFEKNIKDNIENEKNQKNAHKFFNKKVIGISDVIGNNLVVGFCKFYSKDKKTIFNIISNEEANFKGDLYLYSEELLYGLCKMNNNERLLLIQSQSAISKNDDKNGSFSKYEMMAILEKHDFNSQVWQENVDFLIILRYYAFYINQGNK